MTQTTTVTAAVCGVCPEKTSTDTLPVISKDGRFVGPVGMEVAATAGVYLKMILSTDTSSATNRAIGGACRTGRRPTVKAARSRGLVPSVTSSVCLRTATVSAITGGSVISFVIVGIVSKETGAASVGN